ncbi:MAG: DUF3800 domain-containing protein [Candidatus Zixiibacteriota bacterium]|nr:MAG: DUF3800 domain-containing protein [candidate division Zixibacteria bacterium]
MKKPEESTIYYFVDESGDPFFYNRKGEFIVGKGGCSPVLIMGFIETLNPTIIRKELVGLRKEIADDPYLSGIPSMDKTKIAFHAKDDCPEVRLAVFRKLRQLEFKAQFIVARKNEDIFRNKFNCEDNQFYDHLITTLFQNVLHRYKISKIYFSKRGSRDRQKPLLNAINGAILRFEKKWKTSIAKDIKFSVNAQIPSDETCLQVIDYMNWAVYRAFVNKEMRFYRTVEDKVSLLADIYDEANYANSKNWYTRKNPFDCEKISPVLARPG